MIIPSKPDACPNHGQVITRFYLSNVVMPDSSWFFWRFDLPNKLPGSQCAVKRR
jgi:hypothetical protein